MKALSAAVVFLAISFSARAEFLVYKGTVRHFDPRDAVGVVARPCYLVVNISTKEVAFVSSFSVKKVKKHDVSDVFVTRVFPFDRLDGKTVTGIGYAKFTDFGGGAFANEALFLHGAPVTVTVAAGATDQQPKTLTGSNSAEIVGLLARYEENTFALTFSQALTVQANAINGLTTVQELQALTAL